MEDDCITLRSDIQQCIANKTGLDTKYHNLLFNRFNMKLINSLGCFETLEISPDESLMRFKGNIAKDLHFTEEEMTSIKQQLWVKNTQETIKQIIEKNKTEQQKQNEKIIAEIKLRDWLNAIDEMQAITKPKSEIKKEKAEKVLKLIQNLLNNIGLNLEYEKGETMIMLSGTFEYLNFTKNQLRLLADLVQALDLFLIAPNYDYEDEENEDCNGIRVVLSINICEEE